MLRITCPVCGERDYTEFRYGGDATKPRPAHGTGDRRAWHDYLFVFLNPKGLHREYWQHVLGCREWLVLERNTATNQVGEAILARPTSQPPPRAAGKG
jgi:sarcosine oxidase subunit delta